MLPKFKPVFLKDMEAMEEYQEQEGFLSLQERFGKGYKVPGSCDAQVVLAMATQIRLMEDFMQALPVLGFLGDKVFIQAYE